MEDIEHHVQEEEGEMFPLIEEQFDAGDARGARRRKWKKKKGTLVSLVGTSLTSY